jgi:uncharacterized protein (DUF4415 family)
VLVEQPDGSYRPATGETDLSRVDRTSEAELTAAIAADPDDPANDPDFWERARLVYPNKERVTLRLDADLLAWFRRQGRGYQSSINAILRRHYEHVRERSRPRPPTGLEWASLPTDAGVAEMLGMAPCGCVSALRCDNALPRNSRCG